jgi:hypothetical protein
MRIKKSECAYWWAGQCRACTDICRYSSIEEKTMQKDELKLPITIDVTAADIKHGKKGDCNSCPVALAASRVSNDFYAWAGCFSLRIFGIRYNYPREIVQWVHDFDADKPVKPVSFTITEPSSEFDL